MSDVAVTVINKSMTQITGHKGAINEKVGYLGYNLLWFVKKVKKVIQFN